MGSGRPLNSPAHISALYGHSRRNVYFARIGVFSGLGGNLQGGGLYLAYASALYAVPTSIGFEQWRNSKGMGHRYSKVADYGTHVSEIMQISLVHIAQPVLKDGIVERSEIISCGLGA